MAAIKISTNQLRSLLISDSLRGAVEVDSEGDISPKGAKSIAFEFQPRVDPAARLGESLTSLKLQLMAAARVANYHISFT
ncbi:MAG: hypothetical protein HQK96_17615 [Nitrospirae bacterium]|nr:hypothetical protein [Nitrospirota bacterium]